MNRYRVIIEGSQFSNKVGTVAEPRPDDDYWEVFLVFESDDGPLSPLGFMWEELEKLP